MVRTQSAADYAPSNLPVDNVDWFQVELAYRYSLMSLEILASKNGISQRLMNEKAMQEGWFESTTTK